MKPTRSRKGKSASDKAPPSKQKGRNGDKRTQPPVRIVDLAPERTTRATEEQAKETEAAERQDREVSWDPRELIAQRAYALYEAGGYEQGKEVEHWLEAERQVEAEARGWNS